MEQPSVRKRTTRSSARAGRHASASSSDDDDSNSNGVINSNSNNKKPKQKQQQSSEEEEHTSRSLQALIVTLLAVPWVVLLAMKLQSNAGKGKGVDKDALSTAAMSLMKELESNMAIRAGFQAIPDTFKDRNFLLLALALSVSHVLYFFIWTNSKWWYNLWGGKTASFPPYRVLAMCAHTIKAFQFTSFLIWYFGMKQLQTYLLNPSQAITDAQQFAGSVALPQAVLAGELMILGQLLNFAVYHTIGEAGVYYGVRLNRKVPWVHGFPFNVAYHPQYLGSVLSHWGLACLLANEQNAPKGVFAVPTLLLGYYSFSSWVEAYL